jgi:hypothetical protein
MLQNIKNPATSAGRCFLIRNSIGVRKTTVSYVKIVTPGSVLYAEAQIVQKPGTCFTDIPLVWNVSRKVKRKGDCIVATRNERVTIVGAGGVGQWMILASCFMNYRAVTVIDGDTFEGSNRSRQLGQSGSNKAVYWQDFLRERGIDALGVPEYITEENLSLLNDASAVFCCPDNHKTRSIVGKYCLEIGTPCYILGNDAGEGQAIKFSEKAMKKWEELRNPPDKLPGEETCTERLQSSARSQTMTENFMTAASALCLVSSRMDEAHHNIKEGIRVR